MRIRVPRCPRMFVVSLDDIRIDAPSLFLSYYIYLDDLAIPEEEIKAMVRPEDRREYKFTRAEMQLYNALYEIVERCY